VPIWDEGAGSPCNNAAWAEAYLRTKWHLDPCSRLGIIDMGRKFGRGFCSLFGEGELGPHPTQCRLGRGLSSYQYKVASLSIDMAENWGAVPL